MQSIDMQTQRIPTSRHLIGWAAFGQEVAFTSGGPGTGTSSISDTRSNLYVQVAVIVICLGRIQRIWKERCFTHLKFVFVVLQV